VLTAFPPADPPDAVDVGAPPLSFEVELEIRLQDRLPATSTLIAKNILPLDWDITTLLPLWVVVLVDWLLISIDLYKPSANPLKVRYRIGHFKLG
jgi:hypothetical protein